MRMTYGSCSMWKSGVQQRAVNRVCEKFPFWDSHGRRFQKATLKRSYYQRKALLQAAHLPRGVIVPIPRGEAVERYLAEVRSVFVWLESSVATLISRVRAATSVRVSMLS